MRSLILFARFLAAAGVGAYGGTTLAGLVTLLTTQMHTPDTWAGGLPILVPLGAAVGAVLARTTRHWLFPHTNPATRRHLGALLGAAALPLSTALGGDPTAATLAVPLMILGSIATAWPWCRIHLRPPRPPAHHAGHLVPLRHTKR